MISVIMSVYNEKKEWIDEAITSIITQSYQDIELIVVVDNPKVSYEIKDYLVQVSSIYPKMTVVYNDCNCGLAVSMNKAISLASGEYIARMDADDISLPNRLKRELEILSDSNAVMVTSNRIIIDEDGNEIEKGLPISKNQDFELMYTNRIVHPSVLMKTDAVKSVGGYRNFRKSQDYDLWLRFASSGYTIIGLDEYLLKYRVRSNAISKTQRVEQYYTSKYQKKLYKQRLRTGNDSFSEKAYDDYMKSKHITPEKNQRGAKAFMYLDCAKKDKKHALLNICKAFVTYPSITLSSILNSSKREITRRFSKNHE